MIPYSKQKIEKKDIISVIKVLKSNFITQGKKVEDFEKKICKFVNVKYGVACNSATSALHIACLALKLKKGDYLWTVSNSFVASANCGRYCGANIDFIDINSDTFNIDVNHLEKKLKTTPKSRLPKVIVVVHFAGEPAEMQKILRLKKKYRFYIIEDASHALGAKIDKSLVGSCKFSDLTVFSFHPVKPITTAEGGIVTTNSKNYYNDMTMLRNHGITRNLKFLKKKNKSYWYYEQQLLGFNYRMNDLEAALGISQIDNLKKFNTAREKIVNYYRKTLNGLPVKFQLLSKKNFSTHHLCVMKLDFKKINSTYDKIFSQFRKKNIGVNLHYLPIYSHPYYKKIKKYKKLKNTEEYYKSSFSIPVFPSLSSKTQKNICKKIKQVILNNL